eukprot:11430527-Alexandrium_andersonii.AAC.1
MQPAAAACALGRLGGCRSAWGLHPGHRTLLLACGYIGAAAHYLALAVEVDDATVWAPSWRSGVARGPHGREWHWPAA